MANVDKYGYITLDEDTETSSKKNSGTNNSSSANYRYRSGLMASPEMFWFLTIVIAVGIQALVQGIWGTTIVGKVFGYEYGSGIESWGTNLAILIGPWGFVVCGLIGTLIYNLKLCDDGKWHGYKGYHYVLSVLMSAACSAAWIPIIWIISIAIMVIAVVFGLVIVIGIISGG